MGSDFLERAKKTFRRSWDRERVALATSNLFTRQPECERRSIIGEIVNGAEVSAGEKLTIEKYRDYLVARRGLAEVVRITQPPNDVLIGIEQSCGVGVGTIDHVHRASATVEITVC